MKAHHALFALMSWAGLWVLPIGAELIHLSPTLNSPRLHVRANHAAVPWDGSSAFVTDLDVYYDAQAQPGLLDPAKNYWTARVEIPHLAVFNISRPLHTAYAWEQGMAFEYLVTGPGVYEHFEFWLLFDRLIPVDGTLPVPPLPPLGFTEYSESYFRIHGVHSMFPLDDLAEAYGGGEIFAVNFVPQFVPIPEPSTYSVAALLILGCAVATRRWFRRA